MVQGRDPAECSDGAINVVDDGGDLDGAEPSWWDGVSRCSICEDILWC